MHKSKIHSTFFWTSGRNLLWIGSAALTLFLMPFTQAQAAVYLYSVDNIYSGTAPAGPAPWLTATFTDTGVNKVRLELSTSGLQGNEFVGGWYFNYAPSADVNHLLFTRATDTPPGPTSVNFGTFSAGGGGSYDIFIDTPEKAVDRFRANQTLSFDITSSDPLNASMFNFLSSPQGGNGVYYTAAHIQAIGDSGKSGWIGSGDTIVPVPEPTTYIMLASLLGITLFYKKRQKSSA